MSDTREFDGITLKRVRDYVWEIPQEDGMNVPGRVLASEPLLEQIGDDMTLQQLKNAAHLPGMTKYAICMPDGHQGYGFPVGGVGAIDATTGCISPGAVGYDINCLSGDSEVLLSFGRRREIRNLAGDFEREQAVVAAGETETDSEIRLFTETAHEPVYEVETATGDRIEATADHPFRTAEGQVELEDLDPGDEVYVHPFEGLPDEEPPEFVVLDQTDFSDEDPQLVRTLHERDLLPLRSTDEAFSRLLKLVGYHTGDGLFSDSRSWFRGGRPDLVAIREDIEALGFTPSRVRKREEGHETDETGFGSAEHSICVTAEAFKHLLVRLGAPEGPSVESRFSLPDYLDRVTDWQRALYLSAFFGAAMSAPAAMTDKDFECPSVSHDRVISERDAGEGFMQELMRHLDELGVATNALEEVGRTERAGGETVRLRFGVNNDSETLIRFFSRVGYRYAQEKQRQAALAIQYLKLQRRAGEEPACHAETDRPLTDGGASVLANGRRTGGDDDRVVKCKRNGHPRSSATFPDYDEFCEGTDVRGDLSVATSVENVRKKGPKAVYDIGVSHDAHTFVANGFVVSNCGVRMMRTDLEYEDVRGREEELVETLFANIPTGLGGGGIVEGDNDTVEAVLRRGVDWAHEQGYATEPDLACCEDEGRRSDARPEYVSQRAKDRGKNQLGSLGSGNHFLEVQRVTDVYAAETADAFGLQKDQIVVLIHCGSRGLGHQVCTDYLREIEEEHPDLLARLPDKELAAAPAGSQLAEEYYGAMCAAINFAWVNRQLVMHRTRRVFERVFDRDWETMGMELLYDVAHNIAKREVHEVDGEDRELFVHRKGATRAFPAGRPEVPSTYRDVGQPVIIPGSMGAGSYVLVGGSESMAQTFGSTAHGAGRVMSRTRAKDEYWGETVQDELRDQQAIYVKAQSGATVAEEAPGVYKDVDEVVRVSDALGIGDKVARTYPVCNIKG